MADRSKYEEVPIRLARQDDLQEILKISLHYHWPMNLRAFEDAQQSGYLYVVAPEPGQQHSFESSGNVGAPKVLGSLCAYPQGECWAIGLVLTDPAHERKGIATRLMKHGIEICRNDPSKPDRMFLTSTHFGAPVYLRLGFERIKGDLIMLLGPLLKIASNVPSKSTRFSLPSAWSQKIFFPYQEQESWNAAMDLSEMATSRSLRRTLNAHFADPRQSKRSFCILVLDEKGQAIATAGVRPMGTCRAVVGPVIATDVEIAQYLMECAIRKIVEFPSADPLKEEDMLLLNLDSTEDNEGHLASWAKSIGLDLGMQCQRMELVFPNKKSQEECIALKHKGQFKQWAFMDPAAS